MDMQVLLEKSSIFTEVSKDQMDRTREKHAAVAETTQPKTNLKQRARQSGRHSIGTRKNAPAWRVSDDEHDSEDEGEQDPPSCSLRLAVGATLKGLSTGGPRASLGWSACERTAFRGFEVSHRSADGHSSRGYFAESGL